MDRKGSKKGVGEKDERGMRVGVKRSVNRRPRQEKISGKPVIEKYQFTL